MVDLAANQAADPSTKRTSQMLSTRNKILTIAAGGLMAAVTSNAAFAQAAFTFNACAVDAALCTAAQPSQTVTATGLTPLSDSLVTFSGGGAFTSGATFSENGVVQFTAYTGAISGNTHIGNAAGAGNTNNDTSATYQLFLTFSATGTNNATGTGATLNTTNFTLFLDEGTKGTIPSPSTAAPSLTVAPTINQSTDTFVQLATGSLIAGTGNTVITTTPSFSESFSALLNTTGAGDSPAFFIAPVPFLNIAFASLTGTQPTACNGTQTSNNTPFGTTCNGNPTEVVLDSQGGIVDFAAVPEPASIGIFGSALFGLGWIRRRQNKNGKNA
jgi:hypothetical protein